jgi:hypothetical protein
MRLKLLQQILSMQLGPFLVLTCTRLDKTGCWVRAELNPRVFVIPLHEPHARLLIL